jgi:hypothetical protein
VTGGEPLDERYFAWLYAQIGSIKNRNPAKSHWLLAKQLYSKEFLFYIPNDDNRAEDGKFLREEFLNENPEDCTGTVEAWLDLGCSFLEMLIAVSRRASFEAPEEGNNTPGDWFWRIMRNLDLDWYTDKVRIPNREGAIDHVLEAVMTRTYHADGSGGMFPLMDPTSDQRTTEIWYQMAAYLIENQDADLLS